MIRRFIEFIEWRRWEIWALFAEFWFSVPCIFFIGIFPLIASPAMFVLLVARSVMRENWGIGPGPALGYFLILGQLFVASTLLLLISEYVLQAINTRSARYRLKWIIGIGCLAVASWSFPIWGSHGFVDYSPLRTAWHLFY